MKRLFDFIFALSMLILFMPIIIITALLIKIKLGSPILYKQNRPGLNGKPFTIYKFRTMTNEKDQNGNLLLDDKRLTTLGKFMRKHSLDEMPQLLNVLKGDLSLVGPRPLKMEYLSLYNSFQKRRHDVKPGITGWAQINGRNEISWEKRFELDVWYVNNRSFILDLKILLITIIKIIRSEGISQEGHVTMTEFKGNKKESGVI
ncbi:sugar transferase [Bacillus sp. 1P02SD]|uniref:sugar transferase n=1 Tax=Bacillus sp. 1P02SD TaxID=3132264 RepID=UPI00399F2E3F